jgi:hypothetical protein
MSGFYQKHFKEKLICSVDTMVHILGTSFYSYKDQNKKTVLFGPYYGIIEAQRLNLPALSIISAIDLGCGNPTIG